MSNGNGEKVWTDTVEIYFNRDTFAMEVGGHAISQQCILAMLAQATRAVDLEVKKAEAIAMQQSLFEQARDRQIADAVRNGSRRHE